MNIEILEQQVVTAEKTLSEVGERLAELKRKYVVISDGGEALVGITRAEYDAKHLELRRALDAARQDFHGAQKRWSDAK